MRRGGLGEGEIVRRVAGAERAGVPALGQPLRGEFADRLEPCEPRGSIKGLAAIQETAGGERVDRVEDREVGGAAHRFRGVEREAAAEHREAREHAALVGLQQLIAPVDGAAKRLLACGSVARARRQQRQTPREPGEHVGGREQPDARGRELER